MKRGEKDDKGSATNKPEILALREPDHEVVRMKEDPDTQDYWETGRTTESASAPKTGNVDHPHKLCYHLSRKGHIKATGPKRRNLGPPNTTEEFKSPCPIEPDHEEVKAREYSDTQEHGEAGITYESLRTQKAGNMACLQKVGHP